MFHKEMALLKDLTKIMDVHDDYFVNVNEVTAFKRKEMLKLIQSHFDKSKNPKKTKRRKKLCPNTKKFY